MEVTLLYFDGCPHWRTAEERLQRLAIDRPDITIRRERVETPEQAEQVGFYGSPSIQVDGVDVFAEPGLPAGLFCRRYSTPDGWEGAPTLEQVRAVLIDR